MWGLTLVVVVHTSTKKVLYIAYYELGVPVPYITL